MEVEEEEEPVYEINNDFPFSKMSLENPEPISNGFYFIKLAVDNKPLHIQLPKCSMKNGIISNKKEKYCDLLYFHKDQEQLIDWIEQMEISCKDMINNKKSFWFQSELTRDDIDNMMTPLYRLYKSGVNILIRTYIDVNKHNGKPNCLFYDDKENDIDISCVDNSQDIIPLIHIEGIRFSSKTFELDIKLTQMMVMDNLIKSGEDCSLGKKDVEENEKKKNIVSFADDDKTKENNVKQQPQPPPQNENDNDNDNENDNDIDNDNHIDNHNDNHIDNHNDNHNLENEILNEIIEVSLDNLETLTLNKTEVLELKKPNQVYYKIYKEARKKALKMRQKAIEAFLEAKQIKTKYMLQHLDDSSDDSENDTYN